MNSHFDEISFFQAVEQRRATEGLSWRELGRRLGLSASTFSRLARGRRPDVDTFVKLLAWLNMSADIFVVGDRPDLSGEVDSLSLIMTALKKDPNLRPDGVAPLQEIVRVAYYGFRRSSPEKEI